MGIITYPEGETPWRLAENGHDIEGPHGVTLKGVNGIVIMGVETLNRVYRTAFLAGKMMGSPETVVIPPPLTPGAYTVKGVVRATNEHIVYEMELPNGQVVKHTVTNQPRKR